LSDIQQDMDDARGVGITGTPTFVLGEASPDGIRGMTIVGVLPYEMLKASIEEQLAGKSGDTLHD
jgi:predicted DsbA family dithiol-disulfide isomerase